MKLKKWIQTIDIYSIRSQRMDFIIILASVFTFGLMFGYGFNESHKVFLLVAFATIYYVLNPDCKTTKIDIPFLMLVLIYYLLAIYQQTDNPIANPLFNLIPYAWVVPTIYILGKMVVGNKGELEHRTFLILISLATGMYIQGLLNFKDGFRDLENHRYYHAVWQSFWSSEIDGARTLWIFGFLMINSALFYCIVSKRKMFSLYIFMATIASLGLDLYFKGRTLTATTIVVFVGMAFLYFFSEKKAKKLLYFVVGLAGIVLVALICYVFNFLGLKDLVDGSWMLKRDGGIFHNLRFQLWKAGVNAIIEFPKGRWSLPAEIYGLETSHNTWIEYGRFYGSIIFWLWVLYIVVILGIVLSTIIKYGHNYKILYWLTAAILAIFFVSMTEPYMAERMELMLFFIFLCGMASGIRDVASAGDYGILHTSIEPNKHRYMLLGLGFLSMALLTNSFMDWWNDRMDLLMGAIVPTVALVLGGLLYKEFSRMVLLGVSAAGFTILGTYMFAISRGTAVYRWGYCIEPFTGSMVEKSVFLAVWILPIAVLLGLLAYHFKIKKSLFVVICIVATGVIWAPRIFDGRVASIIEAIRLQINMPSGLQWIASKENYSGLVTSHCMWLDFARDYGMITLGLLMAFEVWSIVCIVKMILKRNRVMSDYILIVAYVLFNYYFLFEATAITSKYLFAAGLMVYGLIFSSVGAEE